MSEMGVSEDRRAKRHMSSRSSRGSWSSGEATMVIGCRRDGEYGDQGAEVFGVMKRCRV